MPALKRKQKVLGRDNKGLQFRHQLFKRWIVFPQARGKWSPKVTSHKVESFLAVQFPHGGADSQLKWAGILVVSLRGVNFGFWSHLGC